MWIFLASQESLKRHTSLLLPYMWRWNLMLVVHVVRYWVVVVKTWDYTEIAPVVARKVFELDQQKTKVLVNMCLLLLCSFWVSCRQVLLLVVFQYVVGYICRCAFYIQWTMFPLLGSRPSIYGTWSTNHFIIRVLPIIYELNHVNS